MEWRARDGEEERVDCAGLRGNEEENVEVSEGGESVEGINRTTSRESRSKIRMRTMSMRKVDGDAWQKRGRHTESKKARERKSTARTTGERNGTVRMALFGQSYRRDARAINVSGSDTRSGEQFPIRAGKTP